MISPFQVYNGPNTELTVNNLIADHDYHFRVCATRYIADTLRETAPNAPSQIKGQFSSTLKMRIPLDSQDDVTKQAVPTEENEEEVKKKGMTDTQVSLLILGIFLLIGIFFSFFAWEKLIFK